MRGGGTLKGQQRKVYWIPIRPFLLKKEVDVCVETFRLKNGDALFVLYFRLSPIPALRYIRKPNFFWDVWEWKMDKRRKLPRCSCRISTTIFFSKLPLGCFDQVSYLKKLKKNGNEGKKDFARFTGFWHSPVVSEKGYVLRIRLLCRTPRQIMWTLRSIIQRCPA